MHNQSNKLNLRLNLPHAASEKERRRTQSRAKHGCKSVLSLQQSLSEVGLFGEMGDLELGYRGNFNHHKGLYGVEEHECLGFILTDAITKRNVVVSYFANVSLINASRDALDVHELPLVPAKQIFRVLSIHSNDFLPNQGIGQPPLVGTLCRLTLGPGVCPAPCPTK